MILGFKTINKGKPTGFVDKIKNGVKIHTIREDKSDRWKVRNFINFATGVRTKNYNQFGCGGVTKIERIIIYPSHTVTICDGTNSKDLTDKELVELAKNDGFESVADFWEWFKPFGNKFEGKLIHFSFNPMSEMTLEELEEVKKLGAKVKGKIKTIYPSNHKT